MKKTSTLRITLSLILLLSMFIGIISCAPPAEDTGTVTTVPDTSVSDTTKNDDEVTTDQPQAGGPRVIYYEDFEDLNSLDDTGTILSSYKWQIDKKSDGAYADNTTSYKIKIHRRSKMLNLTNNSSSGTDSYLILLTSEQMGAYHENNYTYQYDLIYSDASAADRYIAIVSSYNGGFYNSFHFRNRGTANNQCHNGGSWYTYDTAGANYAANTDNNSIVKKLLGKDYKSSEQAFKDISISIRYVVDWENGNSVYMRVNDEGYPGSGKWTLVSSGTSADSKNYFTKDQGGAAIVLKTGGKQNGYIDNIIVWEGTGDEPADKSSPIFTSLSHECTKHVWLGSGTCNDHVRCKYCNSEKGGDEGHKYVSLSGTTDRRCSVCNALESAINAGQPLGSVPGYDGGTKTKELYRSGYGMGSSAFADADDTYMQIISGTSESEFIAYTKKLEQYGYKQTYNYSLDGNLYAQYTFNGQRIYTYYTASVKEVRIIEDYHSDMSPSEFGYTYKKKANETTVLYQYGVPMNEAGVNISKNDEKKIDCGMMYVMKLADNSVFIMDGGGYQQFDTAEIDGFMQFLYDVTGTPKGGKIRIAGWYISHGHSDHMAGVCLFFKKYHANLTLERIFHNFPSHNSPTPILATTGAGNHRKMINYVNTYFKDDNVKYIKIHTGQVINLADAKITVIYTHEDIVNPKTADTEVANDYNNSCSVINVEFDGVKFALLGDVNKPAMNVIIANNSAYTLKADIVQLSHHVINDLSKLYHIIKAPVVLAPQSPNGSVNGTARKNAMNAARIYLSGNMLYYASIETTGLAVVNGKISKVYSAPVYGGKYGGWGW